MTPPLTTVEASSADDIEEIRHRLHVDGMVSGDRKYIDSIRKYLFGVFLDNEHITMVKSLLEVFCISCSKYFKNGRNRNRVDRTFRNMVDSDILKYCSTEKLFTVLLTLQNEGLKTGSDKDQLISTENLFINEFVDAGRRLTMMVSPLFAGER